MKGHGSTFGRSLRVLAPVSTNVYRSQINELDEKDALLTKRQNLLVKLSMRIDDLESKLLDE